MNREASVILDSEVMLDIDMSGIKLIEASAGTGKTYTIANLYLRQILEGKSPAEILVVTFTNAATEELRGRIRLRLHQALQVLTAKVDLDDAFLIGLKKRFLAQDAQVQQQQIHRLQFSLRCMDEAAISTIHSFCQRVLQNYALPSRQLFENELLSDDDSLWQTAFKDWWRQLTYPLAKGELLFFESSIKSFSDFSHWLDEMRNKPSTQFLPESRHNLQDIFESYRLLENELGQLAKQWHTHKESIGSILRDSKALGRNKNLPYHKNQIDDYLGQLDRYFASDNLLSLPAGFKYIASDVLHENSKPASRGSDPNLDHEFFLFAAKVNQSLETFQKNLKPRALIEAFEYCSQQLKVLKQKNALLSYQDQLELVLEALESNTGEELADILRRQYPVAMIDEFQDTDSIQYNIFKRLYFNQPAISLTLIGDPKQAIYSFRGGDIFTYMQAKQQPDIQHCCLGTNWRSHEDLVNAVNHFFGNREDSFIYSDSIEFTPALAAKENPAQVLSVDGKIETPLTLWHIPRNESNKPFNKEDASSFLNRAVANEIGRLILGGQNKAICIGDRPLQNGDIAILVRSAYQGESLRQVLEQQGINSVTIGKDKVFDSPEAQGLSLLLKAIAYCSDRGLLRQALASSLLDFDHFEIAQITDDEDNWQSWCDGFRVLNNIWTTRGFIPMFQQLLQDFELGLKFAVRPQAERRLTNLLHLGELLQQQSVRSGGIYNLLNWFHRQMQESSSSETELRLESDEALVKIVTIHKSKGLEYPVVFLPYLWSCHSLANQKDGVLFFHNEQLQARVDLGSEDFPAHALLADRERLAEDVRLLYVALTRARSKVYLAWGEAGSRGRSGNSAQTALAYLLHSKQTVKSLSHETANGIENPDEMLNDLSRFSAASQGVIELQTLPLEAGPGNFEIEKGASHQAIVSQFKSDHEIPWKISSFSSLTRDIHQVVHSSNTAHQGDAILDFPAGSQVGLCLHSIFEHLDFKGDIETQCRDLFPRYAPRFGLDIESLTDTLVEWFVQILGTALMQPGLCLSELSSAQRLNELSFDFALDHVDIDKLNALLAQMATKAVEPLNLQDFRGLLTGVIDLVFEYQGKYYLADYKSNLLGSRLEDYQPDKLQQAMIDRRYDLQSLIYTIALHRYLRSRIRHYDYQQHFGGAYYLFIRAMRRQTGMAYGVHFEKPDFNKLQILDRLFDNDRPRN